MTSAGPAPNPSKESASRLRFETPSSKSIVDSTNILGFELTILGLAWETDNECVRSNNLPIVMSAVHIQNACAVENTGTIMLIKNVQINIVDSTGGHREAGFGHGDIT